MELNHVLTTPPSTHALISSCNTLNADVSENEPLTNVPLQCISSCTPAQSTDPVLRELQDVYESLSAHRKNVTKLMANVKRCFGKVEKKLEQLEPSTKTRNKKNVRGGGLAKPFPVSTSLCTFMDVPKGTQLARAEVTQYLHKYIRENNLYDKSNRQYIIPDSSLKTLFNISDEVNAKMHIFSMQEKMNTHFEYNTPARNNSINHNATTSCLETTSVFVE